LRLPTLPRLYDTCAWDIKAVRKLIVEGKVAPRYPGSDTRIGKHEECPICFMFCKANNRTVCCDKPMCTECYLQVKTPTDDSEYVLLVRARSVCSFGGAKRSTRQPG
jgi:hypothetical protein